MNVRFCLWVKTSVSMCDRWQKNFTYEFVPASPVVSKNTWSSFLESLRREGCSCTPAVLWGAASWMSSKQYAALLYSSHLAFSLRASLNSWWCAYAIVLTWLQLEKIPALFHPRVDFFKVDSVNSSQHYWDIATEVCEMVS